MGDGLVRMLGRPHACDRRLRRRREPRSPRADSQPDGFSEGRSHHPERTRATCTTPRSAPSACASSKSARLRSSKRRSVRGRRWSTSSPVRKRTRARSAPERSRRWQRQKRVPVLVDAAAEILTVPNVHLENGATLVAYSGGKCIRGPQSAGLLLGRKDLVQAAWVHSAPHHGFARSMKVGQGRSHRDAHGGRDVDEERPQGRMEPMAVMARSHREACLDDRGRHDVDHGNDGRCPTARRRLSIRWDPKRLGISGAAVAKHLIDTEPRIATPGGRDRDGETSISITPYQMSAGRREDRRRADLRHLSNPPKQDAAARTAAPARGRDRPMGRAHRLPREHVDAYAPSEAGRQPRRRHASRRLRVTRSRPARSTGTAFRCPARTPSGTATP